jgi:hypothetical protein
MPARTSQESRPDHYKQADILLLSAKTQQCSSRSTLGVLTYCCPQLFFVHAQLAEGQPLSTAAASTASTHTQPTNLPSRRQKAWHHWLLLLVLLLDVVGAGASCCVVGCVRLLRVTKGVDGCCSGESFEPAGLPWAEQCTT